MFQTNMSPPSSGSKNKLRKKTAYYLLDVGFLLGLCFNPEETGGKTTVDFKWNTWHYIQGDRTLQS
jgi:hypothetical protein